MAKKSGACDTRCQMLFTEAINTENLRRIEWFRKNQQRLIDNLGSEKLVSTAKARVAEQLEKRRKRFESERREVIRLRHLNLAQPLIIFILSDCTLISLLANCLMIQKQESSSKLPDWRPVIDETLNLDYMRPIEPRVSNLLFEKGAPSHEARKNYLRERCDKLLEDRYYYLYGSSWVYGWRGKDFPPVSPTKVGKRQIIQASFYRRNASSLQRDPSWYRICQTGNSKNYNEVLTY